MAGPTASHDPKLIARFWSKVDVRGPEECWPWLAGRTVQGYGRFGLVNGRKVIASRFVFETKVRILGPDEMACHSCDNPPCCNPSHLFAGTNADNIKDSSQKGRQKAARGRTGRPPVISLARLLDALTAIGLGESQGSVSRRTGISQQYLSILVRGKRGRFDI